MSARPSPSEWMQSMPQALRHGRSRRTMALNLHSLRQRPQRMHLSWSMCACPLMRVMACRGQTDIHGCSRQPWHTFVIFTTLSGHLLQANLMTLMSGFS